MDINVIEILLLLIGLTSIIYAMLKTKDDTVIDDKVEKILDDFITQLGAENEDAIFRMQQLQDDLSNKVNTRLGHLKNRLKSVEDEVQQLKKMNSKRKSAPILSDKYQQVLQLHNDGYTKEQIVNKTKIGHGEIEMLLELIKKGYKYAE